MIVYTLLARQFLIRSRLKPAVQHLFLIGRYQNNKITNIELIKKINAGV